MDLTRRIDLVGYLHVGYGMVLLLLSALIILTVTAGAIVLPGLAAWVSGLGASVTAGLLLAAVGFPSMVAGVLLIRRVRWSRAAVIVLSVVDLFSFPVGTALGAFSLWFLLKERARLQFA
jgi:hypothetical protein